MSLGGSKQKSSSSSTNLGSGIDPTQAGYLNTLWGQGMSQGGNAAAGQQALGLAAQGIQAGANRLYNPYMQGAQQTLQGMQQNTPNPMMDVYSRQIGQQFNEQILPGLNASAMQGGGFGGSRANIGAALAGARSSQQLQDFAAQLYGGDQDRRLNAATMQGQLGMGINEGFQAASANALDAGQFGMGLPWYNLQSQAGLLGSPVVLDKGGTQTSRSKGTSLEASFPVGGKK